MLIIITNRDLWLAKVEKAMAAVRAMRKQKNLEYVKAYQANWSKSRKLFSRRRVTGDPPLPPEDYPFYPTRRGSEDLKLLAQVKAALESSGTGTITLTGEELYDIEYWNLYSDSGEN